MAPRGEGCIRIAQTLIDGVPKLTFWNTGPGLDRNELVRITDMAESIGKVMSLEGNFGIGAKVATLPSNRLGVRYRSCKEGRVHEVTIGEVENAFGRIWRRQGDSQRMVEVADVTVELRAAGVSTDFDWTEVVLLGNRPEQNTLIDPYDSDPVVDRGWIAVALYQRFFALPPNIEFLLDEGTHLGVGVRRFETFAERMEKAFSRHEAVRVGEEIVVHYVYDEPDQERPWATISARDALQPALGRVAIVHKGEVYGSIDHHAWASNGPVFGINVHAKNVTVFIELSDAFPVRPDVYRQHLNYRTGLQKQVLPTDFAGTVRKNVPAWLANLVHSAENIDAHLVAVVQDLERLWNDIIGDNDTTTFPIEILCIREIEEIRYRWLLGRGGQFYKDTGQLALNLQYPSISQVGKILIGLPILQGREDGSELAQTYAELAFIRRLGRGVIYALTKTNMPDLWQSEHIERAIAPEALSILGDDTEEMVTWAKARIHEDITPARADSDQSVSHPQA